MPLNKGNRLELNGQGLEQVNNFNYLGIMVKYNGKVETEITDRLGKVRRLCNILRNTFFLRGVEDVLIKINKI